MSLFSVRMSQFALRTNFDLNVAPFCSKKNNNIFQTENEAKFCLFICCCCFFIAIPYPTSMRLLRNKDSAICNAYAKQTSVFYNINLKNVSFITFSAFSTRQTTKRE